ncbi:MAG: helix-turn-helix transcriptional regulator [Candidatus Brocadiales bacterium]|nr:helix-turn-helix transcriptional regulator [Candidatus Brocadiales bacterium]
MLNFGKAIKRYRIQEELTQKELAKQAGVTPSYLSSLEKGRKEPSIALIKKICNVLKLPYEIMFWESVEINKQVSRQDRKIIELAKTIVRHYFESRNGPTTIAKS